MAKQVGDIIIVGTIDDITFYKMEGRGYAHKKTSLTGKRVKRDPRFKRTMQSAQRLGRGSQLASKVYRSLPRPEQVYGLFKELKRIAILAIKEGKSEVEVMMLLQQQVAKGQGVKKPEAVVAQPKECRKTAQPKKSPRLFRMYDGRAKKASAPRRKGQRLLRPAVQLGTGQGDYPKRE